MQRFCEVTQGLEVRDFPALMELLRSEKKEVGLRGELFEIWVERDLKSARAWFERQPAKERSSFGTRLVAV